MICGVMKKMCQRERGLQCKASDVAELLALQQTLYGAAPGESGEVRGLGGGIRTDGDADCGDASEAVIRHSRCFGRHWMAMVELTGALCRPVTGLWPGITAEQLCQVLRSLGAEVV